MNYIGGVETGIKALEWNIDETLVVIVSGNDTVMVLSADFDPISAEVDLHHDDFGESKNIYFASDSILLKHNFIEQFVNVGWGKKETQFHGSEGKGAARAKPQVEETPAGVLDDNKPRIRWRGDGAFFAVSYIKRSTGACINADLKPQIFMSITGSRQIKVFNREGALHYTTEPTTGLEQSLDWKLSGSVFASTIRLPNKHIVGFFEKNGLRHGEFTLPFKDNQVQVQNF